MLGREVGEGTSDFEESFSILQILTQKGSFQRGNPDAAVLAVGPALMLEVRAQRGGCRGRGSGGPSVFLNEGAAFDGDDRGEFIEQSLPGDHGKGGIRVGWGHSNIMSNVLDIVKGK